MCSLIDPKMYPTKSTYDYMTEINRLFPRTTENDVCQSPNAMPNSQLYSPFRQSTPFNRSSSSADSISPDSFPDMSYRSNPDRQAFETPFIIRRQRPIIGRKIFDNTERVPPTLEPPRPKTFERDIEFPNSIWQPDDQSLFPQTPPSIRVEQKNYTQNILYELFPTEKRGYEFKPPSSRLSPVSNYTPPPSFSNNTPPQSFSSGASQSPVKMNLPRVPTSPFRFPQNRPSIVPSSSRHQEMRPGKMCTFCRKNGETPLVYTTHTVRENVGNRNIVTCPILRSHVCSTCGVSGDNAHTITYCPVLRSNNNGRPLQSTTITLKNTRIKSNGRRRF